MLDDQFCRRLAELRIKKGVSARDMSLSIGQSAGYINNIENGKNFPSMMGFFYICEYLGISPEEFFAFETENPVKSAEYPLRHHQNLGEMIYFCLFQTANMIFLLTSGVICHIITTEEGLL